MKPEKKTRPKGVVEDWLSNRTQRFVSYGTPRMAPAVVSNGSWVPGDWTMTESLPDTWSRHSAPLVANSATKPMRVDDGQTDKKRGTVTTFCTAHDLFFSLSAFQQRNKKKTHGFHDPQHSKSAAGRVVFYTQKANSPLYSLKNASTGSCVAKTSPTGQPGSITVCWRNAA